MSHRILQHFNYPNYKPFRSEIIEPYRALAYELNRLLDEGPEKMECLQKLLQSCDAALRQHETDLANRRHDALISSLAGAVGRTKPGYVPTQIVAEDHNALE